MAIYITIHDDGRVTATDNPEHTCLPAGDATLVSERELRQALRALARRQDASLAALGENLGAKLNALHRMLRHIGKIPDRIPDRMVVRWSTPEPE